MKPSPFVIGKGKENYIDCNRSIVFYGPPMLEKNIAMTMTMKNKFNNKPIIVIPLRGLFCTSAIMKPTAPITMPKNAANKVIIKMNAISISVT